MTDVNAGGAFVRIGVKGAELAQQKLQGLASGLRTMGSQITNYSTALRAPFKAALDQFVTAGDDLDKMSGRTGVAVEHLSEMAHVAQQSGSSIGDFELAIRGMQKGMLSAEAQMSRLSEVSNLKDLQGLASAIRPSADVAGAYRRLAIDFEEVKKQAPIDQFMAITDRLATVENSSTRSALAMQLLGKTGTKILPMLGAIRELRAEANGLGRVMTTKQAKDAAAYADAMARFQSVSESVSREIGAALAPSFISFYDTLTRLSIPLIQFVRNNAAMVGIIFRVGRVGLILGGTLTTLGIAASLLGTGFGALAAIATAAALPLIAITAVVAGLGAVIWFNRGTIIGWGKAIYETLQPIGQQIKRLGEVFTGTIGGIGNAISAGNLQQAVTIAWLGIQAAFFEGARLSADAFAWLFSKASEYIGFLPGLATIAGDAFAGIGDAIMQGDFSLAGAIIWAKLQALFLTGKANLTAIWEGTAIAILDIWDDTTSRIENGTAAMVRTLSSMLGTAFTMLSAGVKSVAEFDPTGRAAAAVGALQAVATAADSMDAQLSQKVAQRDQQRHDARMNRNRQAAAVIAGAEAKADQQNAKAQALIKQAQANAAAGGGLAGIADRKIADLQAAVDAAKKEAAAEQQKRDQQKQQIRDDVAAGTGKAKGSGSQPHGAFSAAAAAIIGIGGGGAADRTARATEQTARNTQRLLDAMQNQPQNPQPVFQ